MNPLLEQFIQESRDFLQGIGAKLIGLEDAPDSAELMTELFRLVHTLKGNSGLFEFPEMTRVLHAGEDLMDAVRDGRVGYSPTLADQLLDAMDFVALLIDEIDQEGAIHAEHAAPSEELSRALRALIPAREDDGGEKTPAAFSTGLPLPEVAAIPEERRMAAWRAAAEGMPLFLIAYRPDEECFFKGEDPFHQARNAPGLAWGATAPREAWPKLMALDCYRCALDFQLLAVVPREALDEYFRYTPEQVRVEPIDPTRLIIPAGHPNGGPVYGEFVAEALELLEAGDREGLKAHARALLELSSPELWLSSDLRWLLAVLEARPDDAPLQRRLIEALNTLTSPDLSDVAERPAETETDPAAGEETRAPRFALGEEDRARVEALLVTQAEILDLPDKGDWLNGRLRSVAATLSACLANLGEPADEIDEMLAAALEAASAEPLREWLEAYLEGMDPGAAEPEPAASAGAGKAATPSPPPPSQAATDSVATAPGGDIKFGRRAEDAMPGKVLKVDQVKVDRLMGLIGEMVVAKNSLPYLANRAEDQYGVRELAREIKGQYGVINRIAEEMQDAIMQVRMMPVSFIFQRFPRLVRDISRKLGKEVNLVLEGEETEADKNIVEALADPLIHIIRNSLDHGLETPEVRTAAGKPRTGCLLIRALQESDRALIEIIDDGRGIDPEVIKRKAYEKGLIDEARLEQIGDREAIQLIFAAGFSTAETVTDLSGRGVGMDVVRNAIDQAGGTVELSSELGKGTTLRLSLPLSMAVTNVMVIESDRQIFGLPMDLVLETVRLPADCIRTIKRKMTAVLRGRIVPLVPLNGLLSIDAAPIPNADGELAVMVVRVGAERVGLLVDDFREVVDVILKPLPGELGKLACYAGSALLGDGSVLMVLNPKELI
ncbi:MAG: chemotaxis protein CheA [Deltaproteobacteria bacterium]|nr:chemotaxis protein CheA [Candidatus Anaeroferrophillacea bacterium]